MSVITAARLRDVLNYDSETGIFTWRRKVAKRRLGAQAGAIGTDGYRRIGVDKQTYAAHRLAWFYVHGEWPVYQIDHRDTFRDHNWIENLREATGSQNMANARRLPHNTSGYKGVTFHRQLGRWQSQICKDGKFFYLGVFTTPEAAHAAYCEAAIEHFREFARVA